MDNLYHTFTDSEFKIQLCIGFVKTRVDFYRFVTSLTN